MVSTGTVFAVLGIAAIVAIMGGVVWPFYNLIPEYVTEVAEVVAVLDDGHCAVMTSDHYLIHDATCPDGISPGNLVEATYDVKIKERVVDSMRRL